MLLPVTLGGELSSFLDELFGTAKPIIAMAHLPALPGTPRYDGSVGLDQVIDRMRVDIRHLLDGGVDGIMFCNEDDRPYTFRAGPEAVAAMTRVVTELHPTDRPFGVDYLWDAISALAMAKATGASFIREVITGTYESDMGLWSPDAAAVFRYRRQISAEDVRIFDNIAPEFASPLGSRSMAQRARSAAVSSVVDAILVSGLTAGMEPDLALIQEAKAALPPSVPVFANTGVNPRNAASLLSVADGAIVGSFFKVDGYTWNPVDPQRVRALMESVRESRQTRPAAAA